MKRFKLLTQKEKNKMYRIYEQLYNLKRDMKDRYKKMGILSDEIDKILGGADEYYENPLFWLVGATLEMDECLGSIERFDEYIQVEAVEE